MAIMHPKDLNEYAPTDSELYVFGLLRDQLPDTFEVFYSVEWSKYENGKFMQSEADFIITSPEYGYLCLEVKGGSGIRVDADGWYIEDRKTGGRQISSPYLQAERSMYYFKELYSLRYNTNYPGIYAAGVIFPFYSVTTALNNINPEFTIDSGDINNIHQKIKRMFREWSGQSYGRKVYREAQHRLLLELIRKKIAISAAAGALVKYKEKQLGVINRVQDNYIYFLSNIRQFYIRGGAGTGKTWIATKIAEQEAQLSPGKVLFVCSSPHLANMVRGQVNPDVDVFDIPTLFSNIADNPDQYSSPLYSGILAGLRDDCKKYSAIFVDEAQDFTEEWAQVIRLLLEDPETSRLGIFYDDVQVLREDSFGEGFGISTPPYLLRENIRNTQNIYKWASETTNLGMDVIANPVEGPTPIRENITTFSQLTYRLESLFDEYLEEEHLPNSSLTILVEDTETFLSMYPDGIAKWSFGDSLESENDILVKSVEEFKGLESDMVIYVHSAVTHQNINYIAYTRAKYYLIELVVGNE